MSFSIISCSSSSNIVNTTAANNESEKVYISIAGWEAIAAAMTIVLCKTPIAFSLKEDISKCQFNVKQLQEYYKEKEISVLSKVVSVREINSKGNQAVIKSLEQLLTKALILGWPIHTLRTTKRYFTLPGIEFVKEDAVLANKYGNACRAEYISILVKKYPEYNFNDHFGMSTRDHYARIVKNSPTVEHYDHIIYDLPKRLLKILVKESSQKEVNLKRLLDCKPLIKFFNRTPRWWQIRYLTTPKKLLTKEDLILLNKAITKIEFNIAFNKRRGHAAKALKKPLSQPIPEEFQKWLIENQPWP